MTHSKWLRGALPLTKNSDCIQRNSRQPRSQVELTAGKRRARAIALLRSLLEDRGFSGKGGRFSINRIKSCSINCAVYAGYFHCISGLGWHWRDRNIMEIADDCVSLNFDYLLLLFNCRTRGQETKGVIISESCWDSIGSASLLTISVFQRALHCIISLLFVSYLLRVFTSCTCSIYSYTVFTATSITARKSSLTFIDIYCTSELLFATPR